MGTLYKTAMVLIISTLVIAYVVGKAAVDEVYEKRIQDLEKQLLLYDSRSKELYAEKTSLETVRQSLTAQLAAEQEKVKQIAIALNSTQKQVTADSSNANASQQIPAQTSAVSQQNNVIPTQQNSNTLVNVTRAS